MQMPSRQTKVDEVLVFFYAFCVRPANASSMDDAIQSLRGVVLLICSIFVLLLMVILLSSADASAGDYTVAYAFDAGDLNDAGMRVDCEYKAPCSITSEKLNLSISLTFWRPDHKKVTIGINGNRAGRPACCYFSDGVLTVDRNARDSLVRLHVFEGRERIRNEFIQNALLGVLYLQFSDMK